MNEKDIVSAYAKELKLASVRENAALFAEDAMSVNDNVKVYQIII